MGHQRIFISIGIVSPCRFTEGINRHDPPCVPIQSADQLIFFCCQRDVLSVFYDFRPCQINFTGFKLHQGFFFLITSPQYGVDPKQEFSGKKRFHHIIVSAKSEPVKFILILPSGREEENRIIPLLLQLFHQS